MLSTVIPFITRRLGKPKGLERLVRKFTPSERFSRQDYLSLHLDGFAVKVRPASHVGWHLFCFGNYETSLRTLMREHVTEGAICLEIGANIGWHTLLLSRLVGSTGAVHAFEPNPSVLVDLRNHLKVNRATNVTLWPMALSDRTGVARFNAPDAGSLGAGDGHLTSGERGDAAPGEIEVKMDTVDHLFPNLERLDFIKIDVEGWEPAVWKGALETIRRHLPVICLEQLSEHLERAGFQTRDATAPLLGLGYQLFAYDDRTQPRALTDPVAHSGDILALPPSSTTR